MKAVLLSIVLLATTAMTQANPPRFKDAESERRYYQALRDQQRYEADRAYWDAKAKSLEQSDRRYFKAPREAAIAGVGHVAGKMGGPVVGNVVKETYRSGLKEFTNDPQYEADKRRRQEQLERERREYEEKQRRYWQEFNRGIQTQNQQIQRGVDRLFSPTPAPTPKKK